MVITWRQPQTGVTSLVIAAVVNIIGSLTNPESLWKVVHAVLAVLSVFTLVVFILAHRRQ